MTRNQPLQTVARLAANRERDAAREMAARRREMEGHARQLSELETYRGQYLRQFQAAGGQGLGVVQLQEYQRFLARLDDAISQQQQLLEASQLSYEESHRCWLRLRGEFKALGKIIERREQQAMRELERREQAEIDDL